MKDKEKREESDESLRIQISCERSPMLGRNDLALIPTLNGAQAWVGSIPGDV